MNYCLLVVLAFLFVIPTNTAQKHFISLGIGTGIAPYSNDTESFCEPSLIFFGNILYNFNKRFSAGFELNVNSAGLPFCDGAPLLGKGDGLGYLAKTKYYFKNSGTRFFASLMAGVYSLDYYIYDEYGQMWGYKIPKETLLGFALEAGVQFRIFQLSASFHHTQSFNYDVEYVINSNGDTAIKSFNPRYSTIQLTVGWNFGVF